MKCTDCGGSGTVVLYQNADGTQISGQCSTCDGTGQADE